MKAYMQAMAKVVDGSDPLALARDKTSGFDAEFASVYRNNSVSALYDVLAANYMSVLDIVGEDFFLKLVHVYIEKYPARQRSLNNYGADFVKIVDKYKIDHRLPYLSDICHLDRAWTLAHLAADSDLLAIEDLAKLAEQGTNLEQVKLTLAPGVALLKLQWPVFDIWSKIRAEQKLDEQVELEKQKQYVLVWRYENMVNYRVLEPAEHSFLTALRNGENLAAAVNAAIIDMPPDSGEQEITALLPNAVGAGLFVSL
ncbi:MAG: DNA-binding domain-containing protein [Robiginitomaculum sp.]|nr:DNA-binding domain-containing protein [Robiginitomaculum sp.]